MGRDATKRKWSIALPNPVLVAKNSFRKVSEAFAKHRREPAGLRHRFGNYF